MPSSWPRTTWSSPPSSPTAWSCWPHGEIVADGPTAEVVVSSPAFAPQVAKILAPGHWLTVGQVAEALAAADTP